MPIKIFAAAILRVVGGLRCSDSKPCDTSLKCSDRGGFAPAKPPDAS